MTVSKFLHSLPRNFHTHHFILPNTDWRPNLSWFFQNDDSGNDYTRGVAFIPFVCCLILLLIILLWICYQIRKYYKRIKSNSTFEIIKIRSKFTRNAELVLLTLSAICGLIIALVCVGALWETAHDIFEEVDQSADKYDAALSQFYAISDNIDHCVEITRDIEEKGPEDIDKLTKPIGALLLKTDDEIRDIISEGESIDWHIKNHGLEDWLYTFLVITNIVCAILFISVLIETFPCQTASCFKCSWMLASLAFMTTLYVLILFQFTASVFISDGCADKLDTIEQVYDRYDKPWEPFYYYIECDEGAEFPWQAEYNASIKALTQIDILTSAVIVLVKPEGWLRYDLVDLKNTTEDTIRNINMAYDDLQCEYYHDVYEDVADKTCSNVINLWFTIYFMHALMLMFLVCAKVLNARGVVFKRRYFSRLEESFDDRDYGTVGMMPAREPDLQASINL